MVNGEYREGLGGIWGRLGKERKMGRMKGGRREGHVLRIESTFA